MTNTILNKIISYKKNWVINQKNQLPSYILKSKVQNSRRNFYRCLHDNKNQSIFILEYKPASPSKGIITNHPDPIKTANIYKNYATIISIVTDEKYFNGNFNTLYQISNVVEQPILCKDFFISTWQVYFARLYKADAILLMLSVLNDSTYKKLANIAHSLCMGVLTEITNETELKRAISLGAKVIGINNRNLHDLSIDLNRTINLSTSIPKSIIKISESGITNYKHIKKLRRYVDGFLIGTILMIQNKLETAIPKLILGENKICGITRSEDAYVAYKAGAIYGGLIFINHSPRYINVAKASHIVLSTQYLNYVGVFYNETIEHIVTIVNQLNLYAVQLHGSENQDYINKLRVQLPSACEIWKSINMKCKLPFIPYLFNINRYILDNGTGGSGQPFDWSCLVNMKNLHCTILAGGLSIDNCLEASYLGCIGLDFNSGVENSPGIKNHQKIKQIFQILRSY